MALPHVGPLCCFLFRLKPPGPLPFLQHAAPRAGPAGLSMCCPGPPTIVLTNCPALLSSLLPVLLPPPAPTWGRPLLPFLTGNHSLPLCHSARWERSLLSLFCFAFVNCMKGETLSVFMTTEPQSPAPPVACKQMLRASGEPSLGYSWGSGATLAGSEFRPLHLLAK